MLGIPLNKFLPDYCKNELSILDSNKVICNMLCVPTTYVITLSGSAYAIRYY